MNRLFSVGSILVGLVLALTASVAVAADPSGRVARLSHARGDVSYSPAGEREWFRAVVNRPVVPGDQLWTAPRARAELQLGSAAIRMHEHTSLEVLNLNDDIAQFEVNQGSVQITVRRLYPGQSYEIATPTLAFVIDAAGSYRVDVDDEENYTTVAVTAGSGRAYGQRSSFPVRAGEAVRFYDSNLRDYQIYALPRADGFDRFAMERDDRLQRSVSLRYVSEDLVGYADLDEYGSWTTVRGYGPTWFPNRVSPGWAPYRDGHWAWQEPYGWTWIDHAPWGYAPSHYGRWVNVNNRWGWLPGPRRERPVYAPALVAFVGGRNFGVSVSVSGGRGRGGSPIGWFPLGHREAYVPSYSVSRQYFDRVNRSNTDIDPAGLASVFQNDYSGGRGARQSRYQNRGIAGAVTAVPADVFQNSRSVREAAVAINPEMTANAEIRRMAEIAPSAAAVAGFGGAAQARPERGVSDRRVFARRERSREIAPFAQRQRILSENPGIAPAAAPPAAVDTGVQVLGEQRGAIDTRATAPAAPGAVAPLVPLDRAVDPDMERQNRGRGRGDRGQRGVDQAQQQPGKPQPAPAAPQTIQEIAAQRQAEHDARSRGGRVDNAAAAQQRAAEQAALDAAAMRQQAQQREGRRGERGGKDDAAQRAAEQAAAAQAQAAQAAQAQAAQAAQAAAAQAQAGQAQAAQAAAQAAQMEQQRMQLEAEQQAAQQRANAAAEQAASAERERLNREKGEAAAQAERERQAALAQQQAAVAEQQAAVAAQQAEQQRVQAEQAAMAEQQRAAAAAEKEAIQRQQAEQAAQQAEMQRQQAEQAQQAEMQRQQAEQAQAAAQAAQQAAEQAQAEQAAARQKEEDEARERKREAEEALRQGGEQPQ